MYNLSKPRVLSIFFFAKILPKYTLSLWGKNLIDDCRLVWHKTFTCCYYLSGIFFFHRSKKIKQGLNKNFNSINKAWEMASGLWLGKFNGLEHIKSLKFFFFQIFKGLLSSLDYWLLKFAVRNYDHFLKPFSSFIPG